MFRTMFAVASASAVAKPPHIVMIVVDDLGWNDVPWHNADVQAPFLTDLASQGIELGDYHLYKVCSPSRASLMSGRYPNRAGLHNFIGHNTPAAVSAEYSFLPEALQSRGYATHMIGKWHLGYWDWPYVPTSRGFSTFFGFMGGAEDYFNHTHAGCPQQPQGPGYPELDLAITYPNNTLSPQPGYLGQYALDFFVPYINNIIKSHPSSQPLFLWLPFQNVHEPLQVPEKYTKPYAHLVDHLPKSRITLMGMVTALDEAVESVVNALKEKGIWEDTLLIFSTDNGGNLGQAGNNYPLRGGKFSFWEGGNRGIGFVHSASDALIPASLRGSTNSGLFHVADWFATLCDAAGATLPETAIDSISHWAAIQGRNVTSREEIIHETTLKDGAIQVAKIRSGRWNLYIGNPGGVNGWVHPDGTKEDGQEDCSDSPCLFDMSTDLTEHYNVASEHPEVVAQLSARLLEASVCPDDRCELDTYDGPNDACDAFDLYGAYGPWKVLPSQAMSFQSISV